MKVVEGNELLISHFRKSDKADKCANEHELAENGGTNKTRLARRSRATGKKSKLFVLRVSDRRSTISAFPKRAVEEEKRYIIWAKYNILGRHAGIMDSGSD